MKRNSYLIIIVFILCISYACEKENSSEELTLYWAIEYSEVMKVYDESGANYIELQITGDDEIHVESYLDRTYFTLETYEKDLERNLVVDSNDIVFDDFDDDYDCEIKREKGNIKIETINDSLISDVLCYKWVLHKKATQFKSIETETDKIIFINKRKRRTFSGKIEFINLEYASDDAITCKWYRRWNDGWTSSDWTYTKTDILEYSIKEYSELFYNGKQIACYITNNYGNYSYSADNTKEIIVKFDI